MKKILTLLLLLLTGLMLSAYKRPDVYKIDATKNAQYHNNMGLRYVDEKWYPAAVQEFKMAISLNPNTQATAVYFNNLGDTYMNMGYYRYAQDCYERAIRQYNLNFLYYQNLVKCYKAQNLIDFYTKKYEKSTKSLDMVMLGLLYVEKGNLTRGMIKLDEFCMSEPDLLITGAVRSYLKELAKTIN